MKLLRAYHLRLERKRRLIRSRRKALELNERRNWVKDVPSDAILLFCTLRNERERLPFFLKYYRKLGVQHFVFVDNASDDGTTEYLLAQKDVSIWQTERSYKRAKFGMDWLNALMGRYARDHWTLCVDVDEFFVYPHHDVRPLRALTDWLDASAIKSFGTILLDMYSERPIEKTPYRTGTDPVKKLPYFDAGNYMISRNPRYGNLWIQGGARARAFFQNRPELSPALNKIPLVKWQKGYVYVSSTHTLLPRGLNLVYDEWGGEKATGCLLHTKFLDILQDKAAEELIRKEHYAASREYKSYHDQIGKGLRLWNETSSKYKDWRQLEDLGLMSAGGWL